MNKLKEGFGKQINSKMLWTTLIIGSIIIIATTIIASVIAINKSKVIFASINPKELEEIQKNIVESGNLTDTSKMTEEELQKLNEKEFEEAQKKEQKEDKNNTNNNTTKVPSNKYYIKVNYGAQVVNIYTYDKNGKYTVPVKAFVCSTGIETPKSGIYRIPAKMIWCKMIGDVYAHYVSQIVGNILFHSVPYLEKRNDTLEYWAYDKLGKKDSLGCIRLTTRDALWIFNNCSVGTKVEFYASSNPGPFGKPTAQKISNSPGNLKNWDPTDPDVKNPWRTYKPSNDKNNTTNNTIVNNSVENNQSGKNEIIENTHQGNNTIKNNELENNEIKNNTTKENNETTNNEVQNNQIKNNEQSNKEEKNDMTSNQK